MPGLLRTSFMVVWAVMLGSPFSITAPAGRASRASRHSTIAAIRFACFMFRSFPPAPP